MLLVAPLSKAGPHDTHTFQAEDHNVIKDWWLDQGGSVDGYFYSENATTGSDGTLGNEHICIRDDANKVYVGRSDVCVNMPMDETYSYIQIDEIDWSNPEYVIGQTGDLIGDTSQYWSGCYNLNQGWAGYSSPRGCPTINDNVAQPGQINFSYVQNTLTNIAAINIALEQAGIEATGYNYSWSVKNYDTHNEGNRRAYADTFLVDISITDQNGNTVFSKRYNYSYFIRGWTNMSGEETFANPFDASTLSEIRLDVTGKDIGYWAGYYGPEFANPSIKLNYRYAGNPLEEESLEDQVLLSAQCSADPTFSLECPGYNDAMLAQIAPPQDLYQDPVQTGLPDSTGTADLTGGIINDTMDSSTTGMAGMATSDPATGTTVQETQAATQDPAAESASGTSSGSGRSLNANELNALSAAENAASTATSIAAESSTQSLTSSLSTPDSTGSSGFGAGFDTGSTTAGGGFGSRFGSDTQTNNTNSMGNTGSGSAGASMGGDNSMDLAMGGSVETEDVTGEQALAQSEELGTAADMADIELAQLNLDLIKDIVLEVTNKTMQENMEAQEEAAEEANEQSIAQANAQEDALAKAAMEGSTDEDALAALLGYNPAFRAYQQPQMADGDLYPPRDIYGDKKNYDNPAARFFNGASDTKHRAMIRSQYE